MKLRKEWWDWPYYLLNGWEKNRHYQFDENNTRSYSMQIPYTSEICSFGFEDMRVYSRIYHLALTLEKMTDRPNEYRRYIAKYFCSACWIFLLYEARKRWLRTKILGNIGIRAVLYVNFWGKAIRKVSKCIDLLNSEINIPCCMGRLHVKLFLHSH